MKRTVREDLAELEQANPTQEPVHEQERVSTTDPDATYATKGGPARLGCYDNYLLDNRSCVIVGVQATAARLSQESVAAREMITRFAERRGRDPESVPADATYGNGEFLHWLQERGICSDNPELAAHGLAAGLVDSLGPSVCCWKTLTLCPHVSSLSYLAGETCV